MPYQIALLRLLADGQPHTADAAIAAAHLAPEELAPALADLLGLGIAVDARGGMIRFVEPIELLDADAVNARLPLGLTLAVLDRCASTNALLADLARDGAASGTAIACEIQTAGRGRRGAAWLAPVGASLAFSLLWRFEARATELAGLSLAVGVGCGRALDRLGARGIGFKWPNDVLHEGRKLCGILVEVAFASDAAAVIGVGINVRASERFADRLPYPIADLAMAGVTAGRNAILAELLTALAEACAAFDREGFAAFRDEWTRRHAHHDRTVRIIGNNGAVEGRALGVAEDGALLVATRGGVERFLSGEVSVR
jgi:BirA family biotin operon repressor/biotin-[acetyl-CoA-carboxylase] ligase